MNVLQIKLKLGDDTPAHWFDVDSIDFFNDRVCFVDGVGESVDIEYQCEPLRFAPPSLTDDQQEVLEWLKEEKTNSSLTTFDCIYSFIYGNPEDLVTQIWSELNAKEEAQVLEAFGKWTQEQEEENE